MFLTLSSLQGAVAVRGGRGQRGHRRVDAAARRSSLGAGGGVLPAGRQHVQHDRRQQRGELRGGACFCSA